MGINVSNLLYCGLFLIGFSLNITHPQLTISWSAHRNIDSNASMNSSSPTYFSDYAGLSAKKREPFCAFWTNYSENFLCNETLKIFSKLQQPVC